MPEETCAMCGKVIIKKGKGKRRSNALNCSTPCSKRYARLINDKIKPYINKIQVYKKRLRRIRKRMDELIKNG